MTVLVRLVGPRFVAGVDFDGETIVAIAPLLRAMLRRSGLPWSRAGMRALVRRERWQAQLLEDQCEEPQRVCEKPGAQP